MRREEVSERGRRKRMKPRKVVDSVVSGGSSHFLSLCTVLRGTFP